MAATVSSDAADVDGADLLTVLGLDQETVTQICTEGCSIQQTGNALTTPNYGSDEVDALLQEWCYDPDSPFDEVPRLADGSPDVVSTIVTLFDSLETCTVQMRGENFATIVSKGDIVLAGLFLLHMEMLKGRDTQISKIAVKGRLHSPLLTSEFMRAAKTGNCMDVLSMVKNGLITTETPIGVGKWVARLKQANTPFEKCICEQSSTLPFDENDIKDTEKAKSIGHFCGLFLNSLSTFHCDLGAPLLRAECAQDEDKFMLPHFSARVSTSETHDVVAIFIHFCDALFLKLARNIKSKIHTGERESFFLRASKRVLHHVIALGTLSASVAALQIHHETLISTLKDANPGLLNNLPDELSRFVFRECFIERLFNEWKKTAKRPVVPGHIDPPQLKTIYETQMPFDGQIITPSNLHVRMDTVVCPVAEEYARDIIGMFFSMSRQGIVRPPESAEHAQALVDIRQIHDSSARETSWTTQKDTRLGTRTILRHVVLTNTVMSTLRAVCKTYAAFFKDYVFRPYVDILQYDEDAEAIFGSPSLRGALALGLNFAQRSVKINVYFARKTIERDSSDGEVKEHWQYLNPAAMTPKLNAIKITAETMPDEHGRCVEFPVGQDPKRVARESKRRSWRQTSSMKAKQHTEAESFKDESIYSLHPSTSIEDRMKQHQARRFVTIWDKKIKPHPSLTISKAQAMRFTVRCSKTSAALAKSPSAPIRPIRYKVAFGSVDHAFKPAQGSDDLVKFQPHELKSFKSAVCGHSEYHYVSRISLKANAVSVRAKKRKLRTEAERDERHAASV